MSWTPISKAYTFLQIGGDKPTPVGVVQANDEGYLFAYAKSWLTNESAFAIDPMRLPLISGTFQSQRMFDVLNDATPDNWGRRVMAAQHTHLPSNDIEWLIATRGTGVGALMFSASLDHLARQPQCPHFDYITELAEAVSEVEARQAIHDERLLKLLWHGSSMGGARPKTTVIMDGEEYLAKFTKSSDTFDEAKAEFASMEMARHCGIDVPDTQIYDLPSHTVILVKRFDRTDDPAMRRHYISANTVLGIHKIRPDDMKQAYSYAGIAENIRKISNEPKSELEQLYRRMVLNVALSNTDDHLRNHGLLYSSDKGYSLSPAFDILPHPSQASVHAIGIGVNGRESSFANALSRHESFLLTETEARKVIAEVFDVTRHARSYFKAAGMADDDIYIMQRAIKNSLDLPAQLKTEKRIVNDQSNYLEP